MSKPAKRLRITTPVGVGQFVFVEKPRLKYQSETDYEFSAQLLLPAEDGQKLVDQLTPIAEKAKADALAAAGDDGKKKKAIQACVITLPITKALDEDGEETGDWLLKTKRDATYKSPKDGTILNNTIAIFDSAKKQLSGPGIGRGSKLRLAFDVVPYCQTGTKKAGVSARLMAVQVVELKKWSKDAGDYGFGAEEGGYSAEDAGEPTPFDGGTTPAEAGADKADF